MLVRPLRRMPPRGMATSGTAALGRFAAGEPKISLRFVGHAAVRHLPWLSGRNGPLCPAREVEVRTSYGHHFLSHSMLGGSPSPPFRAGATTLGCSQVQHRALIRSGRSDLANAARRHSPLRPLMRSAANVVAANSKTPQLAVSPEPTAPVSEAAPYREALPTPR